MRNHLLHFSHYFLIRFAIKLGVCCCIVLLHFNHNGQEGHAQDHEKNIRVGTAICGSRCTQRVLSEFGIRESLINLIREIQYPDIQAGANFESISQALEQRNLHTKAIQIRPEEILNWDAPAIVQMKLESGDHHFVVWLPPQDEKSQPMLWDQDLTEVVMKRKRWPSARTGHVLLVSDKPIDSRRVIVDPTQPVSSWWHYPLFIIGAVFAGVLVGLIAQRWTSRWSQ